MSDKETPTAFGIRMIREDAVDKFVAKLTSEEIVLAAAMDRFSHSVSYWKYNYKWDSLPTQSRTRRLDEARRYLQAAIKKAKEAKK